MSLVRDWTTLQELVEAAIIATQVLFEMKGLYLRAELPAEPVEMLCDRTRIREVLLNLISNAGRFTEQGGIYVRAHCEADILIVSVTDTGPGIPKEEQSRLFEPFQRLDSSIRKVGGTGLGLCISKRFVEMHGGKMWVESEVGLGTSFFFSLPLRTRPTDLTTSQVSGARRWVTPYHQFEMQARRSKVPAPDVTPRFVLLDQGNGLQRLFSRYLDNIEIVHTQTLNHALEELNRSPSQALVINHASISLLPESLPQQASIPFATPVITCCVAGDDETARRLGVSSYLLKPVSRERLLKVLDNLGCEIHTILLADDQTEILQLFARILKSTDQGYVVLRAHNGKQALELMRERRPDVVLLDLVMPEMDGFQVIREKNQDENIRDIPLIVISSNDPTGAPIISEQLSITCQGGLSARELLTCVQVISAVLTPDSDAICSAVLALPESDPA
jgi:CheY-like chemotaxis protein